MEDLIEIDGMKIEKVSDDVFIVHSDGEEYDVIFDEKRGVICTCKGWWYNGHCKHIDAVLKVRKTEATGMEEDEK